MYYEKIIKETILHITYAQNVDTCISILGISIHELNFLYKFSLAISSYWINKGLFKNISFSSCCIRSYNKNKNEQEIAVSHNLLGLRIPLILCFYLVMKAIFLPRIPLVSATVPWVFWIRQGDCYDNLQINFDNCFSSVHYKLLIFYNILPCKSFMC